MSGLEASVGKMRRDDVGDAAVEAFADAYRRLEEGETGVLPEAEIEPVEDIPAAGDLPDGPEAGGAIDHAVVIKLNGGLGTSMGMTGPKSLVEVKDGLTFLDIIVRQVLELRERTGARAAARADEQLLDPRRHRSRRSARYDDIEADVPLDFLQNKVPKLLADDLEPAEWPDDPALEWAPPGHGDLYTALVTSGLLDELLERDYRYAFVSNADNLGAVLEPRILAWIAGEGIPFVMEVADRTEADRKGGHIARRRDGRARAARDRPDARRRRRGLPGHRPPPLLQHEHAVGRPAGAPRAARRARRRARAADDRQPQDRRPVGQGLARGRPARDGDGRGDRRLRRRARAARAAPPVRPGEDDERPPRAALGRLRPDRGRPRRAGRGARRPAGRRPRRRALQAARATSRSASPRARRRSSRASA